MLNGTNPGSGKLFLQLQQVSAGKFNAPGLKNINWEIREGETWAITGPGGSGKTTLAEVLAGRIRLQEGIISYHFMPEPARLEELKNYVALISFQPQESALNYASFYYQQRYNSSDTDGIITVKEFLQRTTGATNQDLTRVQVLQVLNLAELLDLEVIKLSNGQTRKMLIARSLLRQPRLIILDNPFSGLDMGARENFKGIIQNLIANGTEVILVIKESEIPESVSHVLVLDNFALKGIFKRDEFLKLNAGAALIEKKDDVDKRQNLFLNHQPATDFEVAVKLENTTISYDGKKVLDQVNWTVKKGDKWGLLGPNGSGKSTLLSLINGDNPQAFANYIFLFDRRKGSGESIWDIKKRIGFISPELHLYFRQNLTAESVAATGFSDTLFPKRSLTPEEERAITNLFGYYDMERLRKKNFLELSASEQRVVLIIRSLVKNPPLLIWDEPYQGLSDQIIRKTQDLLTAYATPAKTIIFVSHYEQEIPEWLSKRLYLEQGRVKEILE